LSGEEREIDSGRSRFAGGAIKRARADPLAFDPAATFGFLGDTRVLTASLDAQARAFRNSEASLTRSRAKFQLSSRDRWVTLHDIPLQVSHLFGGLCDDNPALAINIKYPRRALLSYRFYLRINGQSHALVDETESTNRASRAIAASRFPPRWLLSPSRVGRKGNLAWVSLEDQRDR